MKSNNILQLYNIAPTEQIVESGLRRAGVKVSPQYYFCDNKKRFRLDFAVFCKNGSIALECDNKKAHSGAYHIEKDKIKDIFLQQQGWVMIHLTEQDIVSDLKVCIERVQKAVKKLGGLI